jgi:dienelactone hydrolase
MRSWKVLAYASLAAVTLTGCSSSPAGTPAASPATPAYDRAGQYAVGVTTLDLGSAGPVLGERAATVYYPTRASAAAGHPQFSYSESETLPPALQGVLPAKYDTVTSLVGAYVDPPATAGRTFPVVLFSHGYGGERLYYSHLLAGIASWGYVVVSADYLERGLAAQALKSTVQPTAAQDSAVMQSSLAAAIRASDDPASPMHGVADPGEVAAVGHSAGGQTAFDALDSPPVRTAVGWAPVGPVGTPSGKPVMLIGAEGDDAVRPSSVKRTYASFTGPKTLVEISGEGHNTYTDICAGIRSGGGLISFAVANHFVSPQLAQLGINGCQPDDLAPQRFWPIVQYYTLFQLASVFGGHPTAAVPAPAPGRFPGFTVTVTQEA